MRPVKPIDASPSLFGTLTLVGFVIAGYHSLSLVALYGGAALTLVAGLISVTSAMRRHKLSRIHYLNIGWVILPGLYLLLIVLMLFTYYMVPAWNV
jgi:hypothetical protein